MIYKQYKRIQAVVLDLLFPAHCVVCGVEGVYLCDVCSAELQWVPPQCIRCGIWRLAGSRSLPGRTCLGCRPTSSIDLFISPFAYTDVRVRMLMHALKYQRVVDIGHLFGMLLSQYIRYHSIVLPAVSCIVPIPLHGVRQRRRGFNQSWEIASVFADTERISLCDNVLRRVRSKEPQVDLTGAERRSNVRGVFEAHASLPEKNDHIYILLDDVKTTGATLEEAARTLKNAGAKKIWAISIAH